jgi:Spy/CpxP family protein refolding chaperone
MKTMFKKILTAAAIATIVTVGAIGTTTAPAEAGAKVHLSFGGGGHWGGHGENWGGHWGGGHNYGNPCRRYKRAYRHTGRRHFIRKYRRCMRNWY